MHFIKGPFRRQQGIPAGLEGLGPVPSSNYQRRLKDDVATALLPLRTFNTQQGYHSFIDDMRPGHVAAGVS